jgi:acetolactate synthase-1/2/3 large subunit
MAPRWQSDLIVDLLVAYGFPFVTLNPGASFRGLHDSLVNREGAPPLILCQHEETAVQIAHGWAKATGRPAAAILHDLVGLLHANLAIYYAYIDRAPVLVIGATGPMHEGKRRPHIDWSHSALVQGEAVRNYVKWDYQPTAIEGVPESFARAYSILVTEPRGPVYMCYDAWLQEAPLETEVPLPPPGTAARPAAIGADPEALAGIVDRLLAAEHPLVLAEYAGRQPGGFESLVRFAETAGVAVWDSNAALNFPNRHPLCLSMDKETMGQADAILGLDVRDWEKPTVELKSATREVRPLVPEGCTWMEVGFAEIGISKWSFDYGRFQPCAIRALGDPSLAVPEMTRLAAVRLAGDPALAGRIAARKAAIGARHDAVWAGWQAAAEEDRDASPITLPRLALEVWEAIRGEDWVLSAGTLRRWARKLWDFDAPHRHPGESLGTATQIGISLGVALAHKGTGRIVVDLQPDGDLMFDAGALWVAARERLPILIVMFNNRAYYNDWEHQIRMARLRGTDEGRAHMGMAITDPAPDFAALARAMGCWGEGPIDRPEDIRPALERALAEVRAGRPALLDTITQQR